MINQERTKISYNRHKDKLDRQISNFKEKRKLKIQQEKEENQKKYTIIQKKIESKNLIKPFNEMYNKYKGDYIMLEKQYNEEKQKLELQQKKGTSNKFMAQLTSTQRDMLKIDRELLERSAKTIKNITSIVNPASVLMMKQSKKEQREKKIERKDMNMFVKRNKNLLKSLKDL